MLICLATPVIAYSYYFAPQIAERSDEQVLQQLVASWQKNEKYDALLERTSGEALSKGAPRDAAKLVLTEFSDFECPYCSRASTSLARIVKRFGSDLHFQFVNFPLDKACNPIMENELHESACEAAKAGICAAEQGAFWEMHDAIFARTILSSDSFESIASANGMDASKFTSCMESEETTEKLMADIRLGMESDVSGTPALFLGGRRVDLQKISLDMLPSVIQYMLDNDLSD